MKIEIVPEFEGERPTTEEIEELKRIALVISRTGFRFVALHPLSGRLCMRSMTPEEKKSFEVSCTRT